MRLPPLHGPALLGGIALALAAALALWATPRWQADARQAEAALQQRARAAARPQPARLALSPDQALVQALPVADQLPQRISALVQLAQQQGLQVDSLRQRPAQRLGPAATPLDAEQVPLRLSGSAPYAAWRRLVALALQQDDALVLAELRLARGSVADPALGGTLQWVLLQQRPPTPATTPLAPQARAALPGPLAPTAAAATSAPRPGLPTRAADWPAPPATALAAWQARPEPAPASAAATPVAAAAASATTGPTRPAFPYRWIGQLDDGGPPQLLLASSQRSLALRLGATLDGRWRLQRSADGVLQAQPLPDGEPLPVPGATPPAPP